MFNRCATPHCRYESVLIYLGTPLCERHWSTLCELSMAERKASAARNNPLPLTNDHAKKDST